VCEAADGRARAQGQVPSATLTRTPRARQRLDPWPRASAPRVGSLKRVPARTHPSGGWDGRGLRQGRGHPLEGAGSGEAGDPEFSRAVSSRAQRRIRPKLLALRRLTSTHRPSSFRPFEPDLAPRDAAPRPDTSGGAPLPGGTWEYKHKPGTVSRQKAYDGSTQSALIFAGFGIADVAAAAVVYRRALERGVGRICRGENTMRD
jgi:hypothetical protein